MSMSRTTRIGIWDRLSSAFERTDIVAAGAAQDGAPDEEDMVRTTATRYAPIRDAVERRVNTFLRQDLVSHLEIGFSEILMLHYIEIRADSQGAEELTQFLREFPPDSRVRWVRKLLGPAVGRHVCVDHFLGLDRDFTAEELAETDPFEEKLNQAATPPYRVILHGRWESGPPSEEPGTQPPGPDAPENAARLEGACVQLSIRDAKSPRAGDARVVEIERFPAVLGSSGQADVEISGYYASARHCTLHWEGQQLWLADHSTNGTWVDGERVHRGARIALANGAQLGFGRDRGDAEHERYPAASAQFVRTASETGATPVSPSRPTPVAPGVAAPEAARAADSPPLAVLTIFDASGSPRRDVLKLPFTIGRGTAQDYVVPEANQGVSREHLVIEEINRSGAVTLNRAAIRNGTFAGSHALPERFVWRFGQEIVLGERWTGAPAVRVSLQPVE
jgi:pSer/pThr/pTyr-binding forkhead associated (FHA) protein